SRGSRRSGTPRTGSSSNRAARGGVPRVRPRSDRGALLWRPELPERTGGAVERESRRLTQLKRAAAERSPSVPIRAARGAALGAGDGRVVPLVIPAARAHCGSVVVRLDASSGAVGVAAIG